MLNQCQFIGHLGADPEIKSFSNGGRLCNLRLAVTEKWKDKTSGEQKERTEWVSATITSDGLVKVAERYLRKGSKVYISGKMQTRKWQDQSGADRYSTEIALAGFDAKLVMLDSPKDGGNAGADNQRRRPGDQGYIAPVDDLDDDDLPF
jgi:single-strand DNA-binding protein